MCQRVRDEEDDRAQAASPPKWKVYTMSEQKPALCPPEALFPWSVLPEPPRLPTAGQFRNPESVQEALSDPTHMVSREYLE